MKSHTGIGCFFFSNAPFTPKNSGIVNILLVIDVFYDKNNQKICKCENQDRVRTRSLFIDMFGSTIGRRTKKHVFKKVHYKG